MKNPIPNISDEAVEQIKDFGRIAKKQVIGQVPASNDQVDAGKNQVVDKKVDPITGKKPPTNQQLNDLKQQTAQLQMAKLKKIREDLDKQRLKVSDQQTADSGEPQEETKKPKDDIVAKTLKGSKSTGEFKGLIGG